MGNVQDAGGTDCAGAAADVSAIISMRQLAAPIIIAKHISIFLNMYMIVCSMRQGMCSRCKEDNNEVEYGEVTI